VCIVKWRDVCVTADTAVYRFRANTLLNDKYQAHSVRYINVNFIERLQPKLFTIFHFTVACNSAVHNAFMRLQFAVASSENSSVVLAIDVKTSLRFLILVAFSRL